MDLGKPLRVALAALEAKLATDDWETAVENLSLSMCRYNVCILTLTEQQAEMLINCIGLLGHLVAPIGAIPLKSFGVDFSASPGYCEKPGLSKFDYRLGSTANASLIEPARDMVDTVRVATLSTDGQALN